MKFVDVKEEDITLVRQVFHETNVVLVITGDCDWYGFLPTELIQLISFPDIVSRRASILTYVCPLHGRRSIGCKLVYTVFSRNSEKYSLNLGVPCLRLFSLSAQSISK